MASAIYIILLFTPLLFLINRPKKELLAAASVIAVFIAVNWGFIAGKETVAWDTMALSMGLQYLREVFQAGYLPGWNPYFNSGEPLYIYHYAYAYWQWFIFIAVDYIVPTDPVRLFNIFFAFIFIFYNAGCYLLFQKIFKDPRVVLFSFAVSLFAVSFVIYFQEHSSFYISFYFPFLLFLFLEFMESGDNFALMLVPAYFAIAANAYVPHFVLTAFVVFIGSYLCFAERKRFLPRIGKKTAIYWTAGLLLMLVILLPVFFVFHRLSGFTSPVRTGVEDFMNPDYSATGHHQDFKAMYSIFTITGYNKARAILFVGVIPVMLAGVGVILSKNRFRLTILAAFVGVYFVSLGRNTFLYMLVHYLPTFDYMRHYVIFEIFVQFFVICLAGMGLEYLLEHGREKKAAVYTIFGVAAAMLIFYAAGKYFEYSSDRGALIRGRIFLAVFAISLTALLFFVATSSKYAYYIVMLTVIASLGAFQWYLGSYKFAELKALTKQLSEPEKTDKELVGLAKLLSKDKAFKWTPVREHDYVQSLEVATYNTFESALDRVETAYADPVDRSLLVNKRYFELKDMRDSDYEYFGVDYPKIFVTDSYRVLPEGEIIKAMEDGRNDFVSKGTVFFAKEDVNKDSVALHETGLAFAADVNGGKVSPNTAKAGGKDSGAPFGDAKITVAKYSLNGISVNVSSPKEAFLVYLQNYDRDWKAYVNGERAAISRVNYNFQAVRVSAGASKVEFRFESIYGYLLILHLAGALATMGLTLFYFYARRQERSLRLKRPQGPRGRDDTYKSAA